jgi:hypothetical protein
VEEPAEVNTRWRRWTRLSLRGFRIALLAAGAGLGWIAYLARAQREAVETIEKGGGSARYDWQSRGSYKSSLATWTRWLLGGPWLLGLNFNSACSGKATRDGSGCILETDQVTIHDDFRPRLVSHGQLSHRRKVPRSA